MSRSAAVSGEWKRLSASRRLLSPPHLVLRHLHVDSWGEFLTFELQRLGKKPQHFPFSILHLSFAIVGSMTNVIWKMENATVSAYKAFGGMESFHASAQARTTMSHTAQFPCRTPRAGRCRICANPDTSQRLLQASRAPGSGSKAILMMKPSLRHQ